MSGKVQSLKASGGGKFLPRAFSFPPFPFTLCLSGMQASVEQPSQEQSAKAGRAAMREAAGMGRAYRFADLSAYPLKKRLLIRAADLAFFILIKLIGRTTRFEVEGWEHWERATQGGRLPIYTFWHNRVF